MCGYRISEEPASILRTQIRSELCQKWPRTAAMRNTQRTVRAKGGPLVFLNSAVNDDEWEASRHGRFVVEERRFCLCQTGSWVGPFAGLHAMSKRNISASAGTRTQILCRPSRRLVTIMIDVSHLFTFGVFIRILFSASNNFLQLIRSTSITLKERNIM